MIAEIGHFALILALVTGETEGHLRQVIGAEAEELSLFRDLVRRQCRPRNLELDGRGKNVRRGERRLYDGGVRYARVLLLRERLYRFERCQ